MEAQVMAEIIIENKVLVAESIDLNTGHIVSRSDVSAPIVRSEKLYIIRCVLLDCTIDYLGEAPDDIRLLRDLLPGQQHAVLENLDAAIILDTILRGVKELRAYYSDTVIKPSGVPTTMKIGTNMIDY